MCVHRSICMSESCPYVCAWLRGAHRIYILLCSHPCIYIIVFPFPVSCMMNVGSYFLEVSWMQPTVCRSVAWKKEFYRPPAIRPEDGKTPCSSKSLHEASRSGQEAPRCLQEAPRASKCLARAMLSPNLLPGVPPGPSESFKNLREIYVF